MARPIIPVVNVDTKPFWDGCAEGKLLLQRCAHCGAYRHPPSPTCPHCLSAAHDWIPASGRGSVYTLTVVREARRGWEPLLPYVLAVVELEEGPRLLTNIVGIAPEAVAIGLPVEASFEELGGNMRLPLFRQRAARAAGS